MGFKKKSEPKLHKNLNFQVQVHSPAPSGPRPPNTHTPTHTHIHTCSVTQTPLFDKLCIAPCTGQQFSNIAPLMSALKSPWLSAHVLP